MVAGAAQHGAPLPVGQVAYSQAMFGFGVFEFFLLLLVLAALMTWVLRRL